MGAGEVQYINNTSRMTNRLFLLSDYCFGLSYLWILQWLSSLTAGVSDVVEGIGSSVHLEIFFFFHNPVLNAGMMHSSSYDRVVSYVCCHCVY